jgi:GLPGLI family protein
MILECIKKSVGTIAVLLIVSSSFAQETSGRIVFERKTNLKKRMGDNPRMKNFINDDNKIRKEYFELYFNDSLSAFLPIESEGEAEGFMAYMTTQNTIYQDINNGTFMSKLDLWGSDGYLKDSLSHRDWKITDSKRNLAGYKCRKAMWEQNDSTRIYAWFSIDLVPSIGPEGFWGLPGAILGLATEDGGLIYFAKEVEILEAPIEKMTYEEPKESYTKEEMVDLLAERMGKWVKRKDLEAMFSWY